MEHKIGQRINNIIDLLADDYKKDFGDNAELSFQYPDKEQIVEILMQLRKVIFPEYFKSNSYRVYTIKNHISMLIEDIVFNLTKQISSVLKYDEENKLLNDAQIAQKAENITFKFLEQLPRIREYINTDVEAAYNGDPAAYNTDEIIFSYPGLYAILVNRIAHELYCLKVPIIPRMMTEHAHSCTGIDIHPGAQIGKYFFIDHGTGIVIGETTVIGNNVKIYQGVTLGALSTRGGQKLKNKKRHPTIHDNVTIYSGATILGGDTVVGKDVVVGGNAFITTSISEGARVSIKNQELSYNYKYKKTEKVKCSELEQDENWYYII